MLLYRKLTDAKAAMAEFGLMRLTANELIGVTRSGGSNPPRRVVVSTFGGNHVIFIRYLSFVDMYPICSALGWVQFAGNLAGLKSRS